MIESFEPYSRTARVLHRHSIGIGSLGRIGMPLPSVRRLQSQAVIRTAIRATGKSSAFQLAKSFGRTSYSGKEPVREWALSRCTAYEKCAAGKRVLVLSSGELTGTGAELLRRLPDEAASQVRGALDWPLWRLLDPAPLPLAFINEVMQGCRVRFDWPPIGSWAWRPSALSAYSSVILALIREPLTRRETIEWLWLTMRFSRQMDRLPVYVICYTLWTLAAPYVMRDPVLGDDVGRGILAHAQRHFAQARVFPSTEETCYLASRLLWEAWVPARLVKGDETRIQVDVGRFRTLLLQEGSLGDRRDKAPIFGPLDISGLQAGSFPYWMRPA